MMRNAYVISASNDREFLRSGTTDCATKSKFRVGDTVVVCSNCKIQGVHHSNNWENKCAICGGKSMRIESLDYAFGFREKSEFRSGSGGKIIIIREGSSSNPIETPPASEELSPLACAVICVCIVILIALLIFGVISCTNCMCA